jgi:hypothetical protein
MVYSYFRVAYQALACYVRNLIKHNSIWSEAEGSVGQGTRISTLSCSVTMVARSRRSAVVLLKSEYVRRKKKIEVWTIISFWAVPCFMGLSAVRLWPCGLQPIKAFAVLPVRFRATSANDAAVWHLNRSKLLSCYREGEFMTLSNASRRPARRRSRAFADPFWAASLRQADSEPASGDHTTHDDLQLKRIIMVSPLTLKSDTYNCLVKHFERPFRNFALP